MKCTATETAERLSELLDKVDQLETKVAAFGAHQADDGAVHDPGDAAPPGVVVTEPDQPSEQDRRVFEHMNEQFDLE